MVYFDYLLVAWAIATNVLIGCTADTNVPTKQLYIRRDTPESLVLVWKRLGSFHLFWLSMHDVQHTLSCDWKPQSCGWHLSSGRQSEDPHRHAQMESHVFNHLLKFWNVDWSIKKHEPLELKHATFIASNADPQCKHWLHLWSRHVHALIHLDSTRQQRTVLS